MRTFLTIYAYLMQVVPGPALALRIRGAARASKTGFWKYAVLPSTLSGSYPTTLTCSQEHWIYSISSLSCTVMKNGGTLK